MQGLFSDGAKETRAALSELFERISYHPQRRSPAELASDVVRELAYRGLLREDGAEPQQEDPQADRYKIWRNVVADEPTSTRFRDRDSWLREWDEERAARKK